MLGEAPPSDTATCAQTRAYIAENVPPDPAVKTADEREEAVRHLALRIVFGMEIPALEEDAMRDLAVAVRLSELLAQQTSVAQAERLDRALEFAARPDVSIEAAVMIGATVFGADPDQMPEWRARGYRGIRERVACRRFMARAGKYLPA